MSQVKQVSAGDILTEDGVKAAVAFVNAYREGSLARKRGKTLADQFCEEVVRGNLKDESAADPKYVSFALLAALDVDNYRALWEAAAVPTLDKLRRNDRKGGRQ